MHYDIGLLSLWVGVGVALIVGAIQAAGWRHKILISALLVLGAICIVAALASPWLVEGWPWLVRFMSEAANPTTWMVFFLIVAAYALLGPQFKTSGLKEVGINGNIISLSKEMARLHDDIHAQNNQIALIEQQLAQIGRISEETGRFSDAIKWLERDSAALLFFTTDLVTLAVLRGQIQEGNRYLIPLDSGVETSLREERAKDVNTYIRHVRSAYANTHRGTMISGVLSNAETDAERELREMPEDERPKHIDVLDYRKFLILERCREALLEFLKWQKREKEDEIRQQRPDLLERLSARNSS